jgi:hypothetical protein
MNCVDREDLSDSQGGRLGIVGVTAQPDDGVGDHTGCGIGRTRRARRFWRSVTDVLRVTVGAEALPQTACTLSSIDVVFRLDGRLPTMTALQRQSSKR